MPVYVGIDWAMEHHDVCVTNERADKLGAFRVDHSVAGLERLAQRLAGICPDPGEIHIAIERPDGLLVAALLDRVSVAM
ncbi:MAG TPA: transposase [Frateuria sp.]|uniref:IS110 family transposase n=1 Tax=Frateuria sp. TaxID=2211372 RepID=UPI002D801197|nr:transposase [Frateuria sp.]HET6804389.1 transposase [Frateuria sp.]